ncbi:MAG TPA: hypothetical protein PLW37_01375 [bacterium]|nr:hypothetical protein [bacterium]HNW15137.1 hypothetical protein [bacterium]HNZ52693.1 hypothetical protein [bacterium]HOG42529.1 hypothetical protein [bacterium]HPV20455.1 hypothetical protein [bacterium]
MKTTLLKTFLAITLILFLAVLYLFRQESEMNRKLNEEIIQLKKEKIFVLSEHEECLKHKEMSLKRELIDKYIDSMIVLVNKIEKGTNPSEKELSDFNDRVNFILENMELAGVSKEEATQYLLFVSSARKSIEQYVNGNSGKKE